MEETVYGDLLFFVNFCMDFQCLFLTAKLLHRPFSVWRAALCSAGGALYAVAALFLSTSGPVAFLLDCLVCFLMCLGTFLGKGQGMERVFVSFLAYFAVSFAVGGAMSGMASLLSHIDLPIGESDDVSSVSFFLLAALGGAVTYFWGRLELRRKSAERARLRLTLDGREVVLEAMVDTGNLLVDPVSGRPVVLVDKRAARELFSTPVLEVMLSGGVSGLTALPPEVAKRIRVCPASGATGKGLLLAMAPDAALLSQGHGERSVSLLLAPVPLSTGFDGAEALLPAALISM